MARRGGFLAEMQRAAKASARAHEQQKRAVARAQAQAIRQAEQARKADERARAQAARANEQQRKQAEREAKLAHEAARRAEVDELNAALAVALDEIDSILAATLDVDDFVDLNTLRVVAEHPPFPRPDLEQPLPPPPLVQPPPEPQWIEPARPGGLKGRLSSKAHQEVVAQARAEFDAAHAQWRAHVQAVPAAQANQLQQHQAAELGRQAELATARAEYEAQCAEREHDAAASNAELDALIQGLEVGEDAAVQEYVAIVLANSIYPDAFPVTHEHDFDVSLRELSVTAVVPPPSDMPMTKAYRYVKASDEIVGTDLSQKAQKDRYASAVQQVAVRTLHEIFEADRGGWIQSIALRVATDTVDPATGLPARTVFIAVAADRTFVDFDLANVVPSATLEHLGAQASKNAFGLVGIDPSQGVRTT